MKAIKTTTISILTIGLLAGSAIGVAAQGAAVTGTLTIEQCTDSSGNPVKVEIAVISGGGPICTGTTEFDDSRLTGDYEPADTFFQDDGGEGFSDAFVHVMDTRIANAEGSWSSHDVVYSGYVAEDGEMLAVYEEEGVTVMLGEGAYDGLAAILWMADTEEDPPLGVQPVVGIILDSESTE